MALKKVSDVEEDATTGHHCCVQWWLLVVNVPVAIIGVVFVGLGAWTITDGTFANALQSGSGLLTTSAVILILAGISLFIMGVLGAAAAVMQSRSMLAVYYGCVLLVFVAIIICIVLGYAYRNKLTSSLRDDLYASVRLYDPERPDDPVTKAWDRTQTSLQCCGVANATSTSATNAKPWEAWRANQRLNSGSADSRVPHSCCVITSSDGAHAQCSSDTSVNVNLIFTSDCFDRAMDYLQGHMLILGGVCIAFAVAIIVAAVLAICLYFLAD